MKPAFGFPVPPARLPQLPRFRLSRQVWFDSTARHPSRCAEVSAAAAAAAAERYHARAQNAMFSPEKRVIAWQLGTQLALVRDDCRTCNGAEDEEGYTFVAASMRCWKDGVKGEPYFLGI